MPTYEYRCDACGHEFTIEQRITEPRLTRCPSCDKDALVRLISGGNFILKGGGWYADLYHKPANGSGKDGKPEGGTESKNVEAQSSGKQDSSAKADSKTEATSRSPRSEATSSPSSSSAKE